MKFLLPKPIFSFAFILYFFTSISAQAQTAFKSTFDENKWVEYIEGNMPLVISVPHGGRVTSDSIPIRSCAGAITIADMYTIELAKEIQSYFITHTGRSPHIVIAHLARKHVDQNRELNRGGTCNYKPLDKVWLSYHHFIDAAIKTASKNQQKVMFIDLHGHAHQKQRLELGYNIDVQTLMALHTNEIKNTEKPHGFTSLVMANKGLSIRDALFGEKAMGTLITNYGIPTVPSKQDPYPMGEEPFFSTGPNTRRFTGKSYPNVFGFQLECHKEVRYTKTGRKAAAEAVSKSVIDFLSALNIFDIK